MLGAWILCSFVLGVVAGQMCLVVMAWRLFTSLPRKIQQQLESFDPTTSSSIPPPPIDFDHLSTLPGEDCEWLNRILRLFLEKYRIHLANWIQSRLVEMFRRIDWFRDTAVLLEWPSESAPLVSDIASTVRHDCLYVRLHVRWIDPCRFRLSTKLSLNHPIDRWAVLPAYICIDLKQFVGYVYLGIRLTKQVQLVVSIHPGSQHHFAIQSELGDEKKLRNLPKVCELIKNMIHNHLNTWIHPHYKVFAFGPVS